MTLHIYEDLEQGTPEWLNARCGIITASVVGQLITAKTLKVASNDTSRALTAHLAAERITGYVEPTFPTRAMERGNLDEPLARDHFAEHYAPVDQVGFMVREFDGYKLGYSPDGLVGDDGLIEIKSRTQKIHLKTIIDGHPPLENLAQMQCGLLVSGREWCDYISWSGGMPMWVHRVLPDKKWFAAIHEATEALEESAAKMIDTFLERTAGCPPTERVDHFAEMDISL